LFITAGGGAGPDDSVNRSGQNKLNRDFNCLRWRGGEFLTGLFCVLPCFSVFDPHGCRPAPNPETEQLQGDCRRLPFIFYLQIPLITAKRPWVPGLDPGPGPGGKSPRPTEGGTPAGRNSLRPLATDYVKERRMEFIHPAGNGHAIVPVTAILQERPWAHRLNAETLVRRR